MPHCLSRNCCLFAQGMFVYDTVFFVAAALQSMVASKLDLNDGAALLKALKATRIDGITGELMLEPQTSDRAYLFDLLNVHCINSSTLEGRCQESRDPELRTVMVQNASSSFVPVRPIYWPTGFKPNSVPDDGSLLEPSKCQLRLTGYDSFTAGESITLHIDVANNFGEALSESAYLTITVQKADASTMLFTTDALAPANSTNFTFDLALPGTAGVFDVLVCDKRSGLHVRPSPLRIIVEGTRLLQYIILSAVAAAVVLALGSLLAYQIRAHKEQFKRFIESFLKHEGMLAFKIGWDAWVRPSLPAFAVRCVPRATFASLHRCLQDIGGDGARTTAVDCGSLAFFAFCLSVRTGVFVTALFCSLQLRSTRTRWERLL